jgi:hypothetical protein
MAGPVAVSRSAGGTTHISGITITGYSDYQWTLNGIDIAGPLGTASSYTFDSAGKGNGEYIIGLRVKKDNAWYSISFIIYVSN